MRWRGLSRLYRLLIGLHCFITIILGVDLTESGISAEICVHPIHHEWPILTSHIYMHIISNRSNIMRHHCYSFVCLTSQNIGWTLNFLAGFPNGLKFPSWYSVQLSALSIILSVLCFSHSWNWSSRLTSRADGRQDPAREWKKGKKYFGTFFFWLLLTSLIAYLQTALNLNRSHKVKQSKYSFLCHIKIIKIPHQFWEHHTLSTSRATFFGNRFK